MPPIYAAPRVLYTASEASQSQLNLPPIFMERIIRPKVDRDDRQGL